MKRDLGVVQRHFGSDFSFLSLLLRVLVLKTRCFNLSESDLILGWVFWLSCS